ncbi:MULTISPECIES: mechanosensitive ion channel domain-containing protein [unclassified Leeuwenhoekiella]|mgnify:CR=1 FL=1|uniref:mechanosensitive ion channel family protein n=1 Tax=unclassified Leeuwenhoekiella TaxID=2615029 RepID=UPI000C4D3C4A|nr:MULTISPECIES: mechanosensitive ion channel domain-containing protein [unclassified Leeuwenhoekiella]MAW96386.1 mechanosensitive ion channel protein [Leeuwenhoekiella sp.]MBA81273.1 mechanosensitive ion channel protein [Leeuwenhoekiella sp.]|tara:strand:+ start:43696 stop:44553 length:858 start_codon:yes stop_codon:yes gene_type:complete
MQFDINQVEDYANKFGEKIIDFLPSLLGAILLLIAGLWIIKIINRLVKKFFAKKDYDLTLEKFIQDLINWTLKILLFVVVITQLGVESSSLIAVIGAAGLAIGLALQGSLANFAGGVLILLLRPFKVGDWISAQGVDGSVKEISIFNTRLITFGNQEAIIPNGKLSNDNIINYTSQGIRRNAQTWGISYESDIKLAKEILLKLVNEQDTVLHDPHPEPMIVVTELADSSVNMSLRFWATNDDYWALHWYVLEEGKRRLEEQGIVIPFPQRDVHVFNESGASFTGK